MNVIGIFFSVLLVYYIYKNDWLIFNKIIGCVLGFVGVMVVNFGLGLMDFNFFLMGEGCVVLVVFIFFVVSIYGKCIL